MYFLGKKSGIRDSHEKSAGYGILVKKSGNAESGIPSPAFQTQFKEVVPYLFSKEDPLTLVSIYETIICRNRSFKGQIIGKCTKTMIYSFISVEFHFSRHKIDFLRLIVDLKVWS